MFVFEKVGYEMSKDVQSNDPLKYEQFFRIKHHKTGTYLSEALKLESESSDVSAPSQDSLLR